MPPHSKKKSLKAAKAAAMRKSKKQKSARKSARKSVKKSVKKSKKTATKRGGGNGGNNSRKRKSDEEEKPRKRSRPSAPSSALSGRYWAEPGRQTVVQEVLALPIELRQEIAQYLTGEDLLKLMTMAPAPENGRAHLVPPPRTRHGAPVAVLPNSMARAPMFMPSKLAMLEKKLEKKGIMEFVSGGDLKGIKMLLKNKKLDPAAFQDPDVMHWAVVHGDLDMVKYLHEVHGVLFQGITMLNASASRNIDMMKYLHEKGGVTFNDPNVMHWAVVYGDLDMVKYLHEVHGVSFQGITLYTASNNIDVMKYLHAKGGITFTDRDRDLLLQHPTLELVEFMHSTGMVFPDDMLQTAVYYRDKQIFRFLHETVGLPCTLEVFEQIIAGGHIDLLQYLHTKGQAFPQELLCYAIEHGPRTINIITFLHQTVGLSIGPEEIKSALSFGSGLMRFYIKPWVFPLDLKK